MPSAAPAPMSAAPPVDLRSDTVTRPTAAMRQAMFDAPLGDDVFGDDPSVNALEAEAAELLGKERALFVPSGTMANQLALRAQTRPGDEAVVHAKSHIFNYESGGAPALSGLSLRPIDSADGTLPLDAIDGALHLSDDPHFAPTTLLCLENTVNGCGGVVLPAGYAELATGLVRAHGIRAHLDGARLMNAVVASRRSAADIAAPFDTVSLCLSKGLGAPVGSVLAGDAPTIKRAWRFRKMFGGGMRQAGVLAAAGRHALRHHVERLADDHRRARELAEALAELPGVRVDLERVQTNLVYFGLDDDHPLARVDEQHRSALVVALAERGVLITGGIHRLRAVTHLDVDDDGLARAIDAFRAVLSR